MSTHDPIPTHSPTVSPTGCVTNHHGSGWASSNCSAVGVGGFFFMTIGIPVLGLILAYFWRLYHPRTVVLKKGDRVAVFWRSEGEWYRGSISEVDVEQRTSSVHYDDGDVDPAVDVNADSFVKLGEGGASPGRGAPSPGSTSYQYQELASPAALD